MFQLPLVEFVAVVEVVPDGSLKNPFGLGPVGRLAKMNDQLEGPLEVVFLGPADDELLGLGIEVALMKGGGIDGVEDLLEVLNLDLDELMGRFRHFIIVGEAGFKGRTGTGIRIRMKIRRGLRPEP